MITSQVHSSVNLYFRSHSMQTARDNYQFVKQFLDAYPSYQKNAFWIRYPLWIRFFNTHHSKIVERVMRVFMCQLSQSSYRKTCLLTLRGKCLTRGEVSEWITKNHGWKRSDWLGLWWTAIRISSFLFWTRNHLHKDIQWYQRVLLWKQPESHSLQRSRRGSRDCIQWNRCNFTPFSFIRILY